MTTRYAAVLDETNGRQSAIAFETYEGALRCIRTAVLLDAATGGHVHEAIADDPLMEHIVVGERLDEVTIQYARPVGPVVYQIGDGIDAIVLDWDDTAKTVTASSSAGLLVTAEAVLATLNACYYGVGLGDEDE